MPRVANSRETEKVWNTVQMDGADMLLEEKKVESEQVVSPAERTDNLALFGSNYPEKGGRDIARRRS